VVSPWSGWGGVVIVGAPRYYAPGQTATLLTDITDIRTIVDLIAAVQCAYDSNWYPTGVKSTTPTFDAIALTRHESHGDPTARTAPSTMATTALTARTRRC